MNELADLESHLESLIGRPTDLRPFVCDGSPLDAEVFIVGLNPASPMAADFWDFWQTGVGFDKPRWFDAYKAERQSRPLKPPKTRRRAVSASRGVIEWVNASLGPVKSLETNIYAAASGEYRDLAQHDRVTAPFDFLLEAIKPQVLIVHGADAVTHIRQKRLSAHIIEVKHFSLGWSQRAARDLGLQVRAFLGR